MHANNVGSMPNTKFLFQIAQLHDSARCCKLIISTCMCVQLTATDGDGQAILFELFDKSETRFSVEPSTGWLNLMVPLFAAQQTQIMIQVVAKDNGLV